MMENHVSGGARPCKTRGGEGGYRRNAMKKEKLSGVGEPITERHPGNTREAL